MTLFEVLSILVLFVMTIVSTVRFYIRHGIPDPYLNYGVPILGATAIVAQKAVSQETFLLWFICIGWGGFLITTNFFERCVSVENFLSAYRPRVAAALSGLLFGAAVWVAITEKTITGIVLCAISGLLVVSYSGMLTYPRGKITFYQVTLTLQICLWAVLAGVLASGHLYVLPKEAGQTGILWRLVEGGKFNINGVNAVCERLILNYGGWLVSSYMYFVLGLLYHGLLRLRYRRAATRSYAIVLVLIAYQLIPQVRDSLASAPGIVKLIGSPALLLSALILSLFPVFHSLARVAADIRSRE